MREIDTEALKSIQLNILKDVHSFCVSNNIRYSLAYGTLLGAIRHSGYIPWDDDIDIMIPRDDYERFIRTYTNSKSRVITIYNDSTYILPFAKVYDTETVLIENISAPTHFGVNIDVFPIDVFPEDERSLKKIFREKELLNRLYKIKIIKLGKSVSLFKRLTLAVIQFLLTPISFRRLVKTMERLILGQVSLGSSKAGVFMPVDNSPRWIVRKDLFYSTIDVLFESHYFKAVSDYDTYLKALYGDYMKLPPVEQRRTHHSFSAFYLN